MIKFPAFFEPTIIGKSTSTCPPVRISGSIFRTHLFPIFQFFFFYLAQRFSIFHLGQPFWLRFSDYFWEDASLASHLPLREFFLVFLMPSTSILVFFFCWVLWTICRISFRNGNLTVWAHKFKYRLIYQFKYRLIYNLKLIFLFNLLTM